MSDDQGNPASDNYTFDKPKLLLVEGPDDARLIGHFVDYLKISRDDISIRDYGGRDNLKNELNLITLNSDFRQNVRKLAIIRDADDNGRDSALQSVQQILHNTGLTQSANEIISERANLNIQVHIMCDSSGRGALEDVLLEAASDLWQMACINDYFVCLEATLKDKKDMPRNVAKAQLGVLFASLPKGAFDPAFGDEIEDQLRPERAIQSHYIDREHPVFEGLKDFLRSL